MGESELLIPHVGPLPMATCRTHWNESFDKLKMNSKFVKVVPYDTFFAWCRHGLTVLWGLWGAGISVSNGPVCSSGLSGAVQQ